MYDFKEKNLWGYYERTGDDEYVSGIYCYGGDVAGKTRLSLHRFTLYLLALQSSKIEKHSTLFSVETNDGRAARMRAIRGENYWWKTFQESIEEDEAEAVKYLLCEEEE